MLALAALGFFAGASLAADLPLPRPKAKQHRVLPEAPAGDHTRLEADCLEATDGCRTYRRAEDGKFDALGNIGIACQPKPLSCTKRK